MLNQALGHRPGLRSAPVRVKARPVGRNQKGDEMNRFTMAVVGLLIISVFIGRPHISSFRSSDFKLIRNGQCSDGACTEIIGGTPASGIPVRVVGRIIAKERFYWGDGSGQGSSVKEITYHTYSDSLGKVHIPSKIAFNFIWKSILYSFEDRTEFNFIGDNNIRKVN